MKDKVALLILDMLNAFDFPEGDRLGRVAGRMAPAIARIKQSVAADGGVCIYVNDNFGRWQNDLDAIIQSIEGAHGQGILKLLRPGPRDLFVLKPKHSGFFQTPLPSLLQQKKTTRLVITGVATEACIMATALDAHMREYDVHAPSNAVGSASPARQRAALLLMRHGDIDTSVWQ